MVLMTMSQQNPPDFILIINQVADIGNDNVDAEHVLLGKFQTRINYYNVVSILYYVHILADLAHAA
ncbi:hypothetical protein D3C71_1791590 [compost metagenome]